MSYNLSNLTSANNILDYAIAVNQISNDSVFLLVSILVFVIGFVAMKNYPAKDSFVAASFIAFVLNGILWVSGLVSEALALGFLAVFVVSVLLYKLSD